MIGLIASIVLSCTLGWLVVAGLLPSPFKRSLKFLHLFIAGALALGLPTVVSWISLLTLGRNNMIPGYFAGMSVLSIALGALVLFRKRQSSAVQEQARKPIPRAELIVIAGVTLCCLVTLFALVWNNPYGDEDSYIIWNMRANFLSAQGIDWRDACSQVLSWSHPDYPLLLSLSIAVPWILLHAQPNFVPAAISILFAVVVTGVLMSTVWALRGAKHALIIGAVLIGTPQFVKEAASQMADIPTGCYMLCTVALFVLADRYRAYRYSAVALAGLCAGLAAWTKNEGLLFLVIAAVVRIAVALRLRGLKDGLKEVAAFGGGVALMALCIVLFKLNVPANYMVNQQNSEGLLRRVTDPARLILIARSFLIQSIYWGNWLANPVPMLVLYYAACGFNKTARNKMLMLSPFAITALTVVGYAFAYLVTPVDLAWQINTSLFRLYLQVWPCMLLCLALLVVHSDVPPPEPSPKKKPALVSSPQ